MKKLLWTHGSLLESCISLALIFLIIMNSNNVYAKQPIIPREIIFGNSEKINVQISENEAYISYLANKNGILNVWLAPIDNIGEAKCISNENNRNITKYFWAHDHNHIIYLKDNKGDENDTLYIYNLTTKETKSLFFNTSVKTIILKRSHKHPSKIIIGTNERKKEFFDVFELDLKSLEKKLIFENNEFVHFVFDDNLNLRFAFKPNQEGGQDVYSYKSSDKKPWNLFMQIPFEDAYTTTIIGFFNNNNSIYIGDSRDSNTISLKTLDLKTKKITKIYQNDLCDINTFELNPKTKEIDFVKFEYLKPEFHVLNDSVKEDIEYLKQINESDFAIKRPYNDNKWLVTFTSDDGPAKYYLYDRKSKKAQFLFYTNKKQSKYKWNKMKPVVIESRDGLKLVSYLSLPGMLETPNFVGENRSKIEEDVSRNKRGDSLLPGSYVKKKPIPMVLFVHGGPWARNSFGFHPYHQFFTSRGYAVLSVNFRGSTGFGKDFINAGNREWGSKMHDDLIDAVNWAIKEKIADPKKIAIIGGSYGGYATLIGLTFTPDIFACGVDIVGPSSLHTLLKSIPSYWKPLLKDFEKRIGAFNTPADLEFLKERSPITHVGKIKKPLLIAQGEHDPRVKVAESEQIVTAMKKQRIPVIYALYHNEGHGFRNPNNRLSFIAMMEQFLSNILGGDAEPIGDAFKGTNFTLNGKKPVKDKKFYK